MFETIAPVVFARGGSKGIPHKNLALLGGKTLLRRSIEQGLAAGFSTVFVSTDSQEIAEEARRAGGSVPFLRPSELASDESPEWHSWQHFTSFLSEEYPGKFTHLFVLPTTAPLRAREDLDGVLSLINSGAWDVVVTMTPARRHPRFNMVRQAQEAQVSLYDASSSAVSRRQDVESVYDLTTVAYGAAIDFVVGAKNMWEGRTAGVVVPHERAVDIDTPLDLEFAEFLIRRSLDSGS